MRVVRLAEGLMVRRSLLLGNDIPLAERLSRAKVKNLADLDALVFSDRETARQKLGLRTLGETDRVVSALYRARMELQKKTMMRPTPR
jgi:hypothetical protein